MQVKLVVRCLCYAAYGSLMYAFDRVYDHWWAAAEPVRIRSDEQKKAPS